MDDRSERVDPMTAAPHVRACSDEDLPELEAMVLALYGEDPPGEEMSRAKVQRTARELALHPDKGSVSVLCVGGAIVGYALVIHYWSNEYGGDIASIDELYVKPVWRDRGIGAALLEHLAAGAARTAGTLRGLQVEVTPANTKALAFYSRHGFAPAANWRLFKKL
jgi:GNAT superfamily N-acetyltransferase